MRTLACLIVAAVFAVASISGARAAPFAYGLAYDELYRVDLGTRDATYVGAAGLYAGRALAAFSGLTYGPNGDLYAVAGTHKALVRINSTTGLGSFVGAFGLAGQGSGQFDALDLSMTYGCDGNFWLTSAIKRDLWKVDASSAVITLVGSTGKQISGLTMRNGRLYGTGIGADQGLYVIDTLTAAATRVGALGLSAPWVEPDFGAEGTLWATLSYNPPENREWSDLARIDVATGVATNLGPITGPERLRYFSMKGLAVATPTCQPAPGGGTPTVASLPLQAPWALLLLLLGVLAIGSRHLRRTH